MNRSYYISNDLMLINHHWWYINTIYWPHRLTYLIQNYVFDNIYSTQYTYLNSIEKSSYLIFFKFLKQNFIYYKNIIYLKLFSIERHVLLYFYVRKDALINFVYTSRTLEKITYEHFFVNKCRNCTY